MVDVGKICFLSSLSCPFGTIQILAAHLGSLPIHQSIFNISQFLSLIPSSPPLKKNYFGSDNTVTATIASPWDPVPAPVTVSPLTTAPQKQTDSHFSEASHVPCNIDAKRSQ